jgi:hypothetical protein
MAQSNTYPIQCPQCKGQQDEVLYDSIDVGKEPELRKQLIENRLNGVTCSSCGFKFRVDKNLLYHDSQAGWMIYWNPSDPEHPQEAVLQFNQVLRDLESAAPSGQSLPDVDLVLTRIELVERIFVREADLNPKVIEYIKYLIYTQNLDQFMPETHELLLNGQECNEDHLSFVLKNVQDGKLESVMQYQRETYDSLIELLVEDGDQSLVVQLFPGPYVSARAYLMQDEV